MILAKYFMVLFGHSASDKLFLNQKRKGTNPMRRLAPPLVAALAIVACETPTEMTYEVPPSARYGPTVAFDLATDPALAARWTFDDGVGTQATDVSVNAVHGILVNGPVWVPGYMGTALQFDGVDDHVLVPDDPAINMAGDFTFSLWMNWTESNRDADVFRKGSSDTGANYYYKFELRSNQIRIRLFGPDGGSVLEDPLANRNDGLWHHVAVVRQGVENFLYVDGVQVDRTARGGGDLTNTSNLAFGSMDSGLDDFYNGSLDDVRFYSRALSAQEIGELVNSGDDTAPTIPQTVAATPVDAFSVEVTWVASNDPESGVSFYRVYRDNVLVGEPLAPPFTDDGLTPETSYQYEVSAVNGASMESARGGPAQATTPAAPADGTAPTVPQNVAASPLDPNNIEVTWDASTDPESGVSFYRVYRDNVLVGEPASPPFTDPGLAPSTTYSYEVSAVNGVDLESTRGGPAQATTPAAPDATPPTVPQSVAATPVDAFTIEVTWDESNDPESGVAFYRVYRDNVLVGEPAAPPFTDLGLAPETSYQYEVSAVNGEDMESTRGGPVGAVTPPIDPTPPTTPQNVNADPVNAYAIDVTWDASSDPESGVSFYRVYRDNVLIGEPTAPPFTDGGRTPETTYTYEVSAVNGEDMESTRGGPAQATTPAAGSAGDGIIGHWNFDEFGGSTATDVSGAGNHGALMNGPSWILGRFGAALSFDGNNDHVMVQSPDLDLSGDFTISVWLRFTQTNNDADVLRQGSAGTSPVHYKIEMKDNQIRVRLVGSNRSTVLEDNSSSRNDGEWHLIVVTREGTDSRLYIDGNVIDTNSRWAGDLSNPANLSFGSKDTGDDDHYAGDLDDIRFYNRALSQQEIDTLFNPTT
jgi:hypothetical protein